MFECEHYNELLSSAGGIGVSLMGQVGWAANQNQQLPFGDFVSVLLGGYGSGAAEGYCPPDSEGWHTCIGDRPPKDRLCVFERRGPDQRWVGYADFHPEFNIANLKWQLTGIAKEEAGL